MLETLLGGLMNIHWDRKDLRVLFNDTHKDAGKGLPYVRGKIADYRAIISKLHSGVNTTFQNLIKCKKTKNNVIEILSYFIYINTDRSKMRYTRMLAGPDGLLLNLNELMLTLCAPIIKKNMLDKIDGTYFLIPYNYAFMTWNNATRMNSDPSKYNNIISSFSVNMNTKFGFTTQIFALTLEGLHLGFSSVAQMADKMKRRIHSLRLQQNRSYFENMDLKVFEQTLWGILSHLLESKLFNSVGSFYSFFCSWILYTAKQENGKKILSIIPEYYIEDLSRYFTFYLKEGYFYDEMKRGNAPFNRKIIIQCMIYLMDIENTPLHNIYQRACLCEVLFLFLPNEAMKDKDIERGKVNNPYLYINKYVY